MKSTTSLGLLLARLLLAIVFVAVGANQIKGYSGASNYMQAMGVPGLLLPLVILLQLGGGLAVMLGILTRPISLLLAVFTVVATLIFHHNFADPMQIALFLKDLSMAGGFIALAVAGAGSISLDARLRR
jgi:putative oxidoreductase